MTSPKYTIDDSYLAIQDTTGASRPVRASNIKRVVFDGTQTTIDYVAPPPFGNVPVTWTAVYNHTPMELASCLLEQHMIRAQALNESMKLIRHASAHPEPKSILACTAKLSVACTGKIDRMWASKGHDVCFHCHGARTLKGD